MEHEPSPDSTSLKNLRIARSLSQNDVAEAIGTNANTVSRWERGIAIPSPYYRRKLGELFEIDPQVLFFDLNGKTDKTTAELPPEPETIGGLPNQTEGTSQTDQTTAGLSPEPETIEGLLNQTEAASQENRQAPPVWRKDPSQPHKIPHWLYIPVVIIMIFIMLILGVSWAFSRLIIRTPPDLFPALCSGNFQSANTLANTSIIPTPATSTSPDGETIGLSEGTTIFDRNRPDLQYKLRAAQDNVDNPQDVVSSWNKAISSDKTDAEAQIYLEDWQVLGSDHPHITLVVGVSFSPSSAASPFVNYDGTSRSTLQGAFTAQKECNDQNQQDASRPQVILMIANIGSNGNDTGAKLVADQITEQAREDTTIVGIVGWSFSADSININRELKIKGCPLPMVSPDSASDELEGQHNFFRVALTNSEQAQIAAKFMLNTMHKKRIAILYDDSNTAYGNNLRDDFVKMIQNDQVGLEGYTAGDLKTLQDAFTNVLAQKPDAIFFSSYEKDLFNLFGHIPSTSYANLLIVAAAALDSTNDFTSLPPGLDKIHFPADSTPNEWNGTGQTPPFFQEYQKHFDTLIAPTGLPSIDSDVMLAYDTMSICLHGSEQVLSTQNTITPSDLTNALKQITAAHPLQGVTGPLAFDNKGNQDGNRMIFIEHIDGTKLVIDEKQGCLRVKDNCSS